MSKKTNFTLPRIKYNNKALPTRATLNQFVSRTEKQQNWYKDLKAKQDKKRKYFCPERNDFYNAVSTKKRCTICHKEHHNILYDKTIHDKLVYGEE